MQYTAHGAVSVMKLGNGLWEHTSFNTRLRPTQIGLGTSSTDSSTMGLSYSYGTTANNGNLQSVSYSGGGLSYTQSFGYDALNRLTTSSESGSSWSQTNGYDQYGNRWIDYGGGVHNLAFSTTNNRITTSGYAYDSAGNLTNDTVHSYGFDAENKIKTVDGVTGVYSYDGDGNRVRKNFTLGDKLRMVYSGGQLLAEYDISSGSLKKEYVYGAKGLIATIEPTNGTRYETSDHLGSPRVVTSSTGAVVSRHDYLPFGEELGAGVGGRTTAQGYVGDSTRQHFTSYERDSESGLDYAHARYYSSTQGRFTGADIPLMDQYKTNPQSWNLYTYVGNKPLTYTDPFGLWKQVDCSTGKCWEAEKGDTFSSLAKILNVSAKQLSGFFQNEKIAIGHVFDVSGFGANNTQAAQTQTTYLEVIYWRPSSAHLASRAGHMSYNINGESWSWERGGWRRDSLENYLKQNDWREGIGYVLNDENNPAWAAEFAQQIESFHGDGNSAIPGFGPYGLIHDNCGEAFCRAVNNMGLPRNDKVMPGEHAQYILQKLRPYVKSINFYRYGQTESRPVRR
jgi:RHS repeat-associated protein